MTTTTRTTTTRTTTTGAAWLLAFACAGCNAPPGSMAAFDLDADWTNSDRYFGFPSPSTLRLKSDGTPELSGFPNSRDLPIVSDLLTLATQHPGWPTVPVAYFNFDQPLVKPDPEAVVAAAKDSPLLLLDVDESSPEQGRLFPTVSEVPTYDDFVPHNLLSVAPRPGFVLHARRTYAFVVMRALKDLAGRSLAVPPALDALRRGETPAGARGAAAHALYEPLWATLSKLGIDAREVAAATVFTTGDVVAETAALSDALMPKYPIEIRELSLAPGGAQERFCELFGKVTYPQFQNGVPPFNTGGQFQFTDGALPAKQRDEEAPIVLTIPRTPMPAGGYPLLVYFHGSGGLSTQAVDRGPVTVPGGPEEPGKGPAFVVGAFGLATAASALPVNPERLPGAIDIAYLNLNNLAAFRDTFRQGVIEQRLFLEVLRTLTIPPSVLGACSGPSLPAGESSFHFAPDQLVAQGQSMGGMYTNLIGAVEPRIRAVVPTGAGGFWSLFVLKTSLIPHLASTVAGLLNADTLTFMHPTMQLLETAWEAADPFVYMPRVGRRPLPGHPARPIYEPVGKDDSYFPTVLYDAIALSYEHPEAGDIIWPEMQTALKLDGLDGITPYPVKRNRPSEAGGDYTGVVVQYAGDGIYDPHAIAAQLDSVKYQFGCFLSTFLSTGTAVVPAPAPLGTPCPLE